MARKPDPLFTDVRLYALVDAFLRAMAAENQSRRDPRGMRRRAHSPESRHEGGSA